MSKEYRNNILIICDGSRSEPDYFGHLRNEVIDNHKDIFFKILPIPRNELRKIEEDINDFNIRKGGGKRCESLD